VIIFNGATGGVGQYMAEAVRSQGDEHYSLTSRLEDVDALQNELASISPRGTVTFIHLAARVSVPACENDPDAAYFLNVASAHNAVAAVAEWASQRRLALRVVYISSGHVYAPPTPGHRIAEDAPTGPRSVYAATKLAAEQEVSDVAREHGLPLVIARVFGLLAPRQAENYVLPGLIRRLHRRDLDGIPGLDYSRDYLDARDVCKDLLLLAATADSPGSSTVNVCSGTPITIRQLLATVAEEFHPGHGEQMAASATAAPGRASDVPWLVGDPSLFVRRTGEAPQRTLLTKTVSDAVRELTKQAC
jgi:UDP-glucose 4-epimerase